MAVLSAKDTAGQFTMMDQLMPRDSGPPPHIHERYDEGFFIIEGEVEYAVGLGYERQEILARDGASVWIPGAPCTPSRSGPRPRGR